VPKIKLTAISVARIAPPDKGQVDYFDTAFPAFGVRVSLAGTKTYFVMMRVYGKLVRLSVGKAKVKEDGLGLSLKEAREKAGEFADLASRGIDPRQLKKQEHQDNEGRSKNTFRTVGERFMQQHVKPRLAESTQREYERILFGDDTKAWAHMPVTSITRADVRAVLDAIVDRGSSIAANNTLAYLRKFFNWCAEKDIVEIPPTDRIKPPAPKNIGDRTLNEGELIEVWNAFEAMGGVFGDLFKLLLLTGQRRSEVGGMCLAELANMEGDKPAWEIPGTRTKNSRPHSVPLAPLTVVIIKGRPEFGDHGLLFTTTGKTPVSGFSRAKKQVDALIACQREKVGSDPMPNWTLHDLRRTMVTMMNEHLRIQPHVVESCVNHLSGGAKAGVAGVYNKALYLTERRGGMVAWAVYLAELLDNQ